MDQKSWAKKPLYVPLGEEVVSSGMSIKPTTSIPPHNGHQKEQKDEKLLLSRCPNFNVLATSQLVALATAAEAHQILLVVKAKAHPWNSSAIR